MRFTHLMFGYILPDSMIPDYEQNLLRHLQADEAERDRTQIDYTVDALMETFLLPYQVWPENNQTVAEIIDGAIDYNGLPFDVDNEIAKGTAFPEQQNIILRNQGKIPLCEALALQQCKKEACVLFDAAQNPPACREFKLAFKKS